jgi:ADP-ribose pyrophosphatase
MPFHSFTLNDKGWEDLHEEVAYSSPYVQVREVKVKTATRPEGVNWTVVHRKAACVVVPVLANGDFVLIRQERVPVRGAMWEFPAGQIDVVGSDFFENGLREMREETGYEAAPDAEITAMGRFFTSPGMTDEVCYLMRVKPVQPSPEGAQHDQEEAILERRIVSPATLRQMIAEGELCDANSLAAFGRMVAMGLL